MPASRQFQILVVFTISVFTSALLLFGVQPMFARMILPNLGGSPSVWSVAMVFFQTMLLVGYLYAHFVAKIRQTAVGVGIHLVLLVVAGLTLPLAIASGWGEPPSRGTEIWLIGLFAASIGLPFLALAANTPLLQAWFVRTGHRDAHDPYFLYAASNVGSFLALLSYPVLLEPTLTLHSQSRLWTFGFWLLVVLIAACAVLVLRSSPAAAVEEARETAEPPPTWSKIGRWIFLAAVPSGLLVAVTAHISTDVAAAPLLWILPLALYLLTWVIVFQRRPLLPHSWMVALQPLAILMVVTLLALAKTSLLLINLGGHLLGFFVIALVAHGELARQRPAAAYLTTFYVCLSAGGMVGGLFAGLIAPHVFSWIAEYPILLALAALCRPLPPFDRNAASRWLFIAVVIIAVIVLAPGLAFGWTVPLEHAEWLVPVVVGFAILGVLLLVANFPYSAAVAVAIGLAVLRVYPIDQSRVETVRSFFGVHKIFDTPDGQYRVLMHGTTIHGAQHLTDNGKPIEGRPVPDTYYGPDSPMAQSIRAARALKDGPINAAIIGLGSGTLSCHIGPGDTWKFFEIDPTIVEISRDKPRFGYVRACAPDAPIVIGDARLTLAKEPDGSFDVIVVDAYSSDAIPIHLATQEAMALYKRKLTPNGLVVMHVSNRHLELASVVAGIAAANGMKTWRADADSNSDDYYTFGSEVVVAANGPEAVVGLVTDEVWEPTEPDPQQRVWTDDYSNVIGAVMRRLDWRELGFFGRFFGKDADSGDE